MHKFTLCALYTYPCVHLKINVFFGLNCLGDCVVRDPGGRLKLYCKGADIVVLERLQRDCPLQESTERALEVRRL